MSFQEFKNSEIVGDVLFRAFGLNVVAYSDWYDFKAAVLQSRPDDFVNRVRMIATKLSASECAVLCASLTAVDYVWLADDISDKHTWSLIDRCDLSTKRALSAAIAASI